LGEAWADMIAALYIDPRGPYPKMADVDAWDETRDATQYDGPWPVVAHPPCGPWGKLRHMSKHDNPGLAPYAVFQARTWGGVVEHPRDSRLFHDMPLPLPGEPPDEYGGYSIDVNQCEWGHVTRKPTRLYLVRVPVTALEPPPFPGREPTHSICNGRGQRLKDGTIRKRATALEARATPRAFAEYLYRLACATRT
jgi:hypothetical protein